jgi:hypothetical protein
MDTPRKTKLYLQLAKDFLPKQADMMICQYIEGLERRIAVLEGRLSGIEEAKAAEDAKPARGRQKKETPEAPDPAETE